MFISTALRFKMVEIMNYKFRYSHYHIQTRVCTVQLRVIRPVKQ